MLKVLNWADFPGGRHPVGSCLTEVLGWPRKAACVSVIYAAMGFSASPCNPLPWSLCTAAFFCLQGSRPGYKSVEQPTPSILTRWLLSQGFLWVISLTGAFTSSAANKNAFFSSLTRDFMIQGSKKNQRKQDSGFRDLDLQWHCTKSALAVLFITETNNTYLPPGMVGERVSVKCLLVPDVLHLNYRNVCFILFSRNSTLCSIGGMVDSWKNVFYIIFALVSALRGEQTM